MLMTRPNRLPSRQRGLSIVELLVGVAVGLFIIGGGVKLFVDNLTNNRRMLVETRVNQDLRAAADLIVRDLRRAGYWQNAQAGVEPPGLLNPYRVVDDTTVANQISYSYAKDNNNIRAATEEFGVKREVDGATGRGVIQMRTGGGWQTITDPGTLDIPVGGLSIPASTIRNVEMWDSCTCLFERTCVQEQFLDPNPITGVTGVYFNNRPRLAVRQYTLVLSGSAATDARVVREIRQSVRVRNDEVVGVCPP